MWLPIHAINIFERVNGKITSPRYGYLLDNVPIQKWDIKQPQTIRNHPWVPQPKLQQVRNHIWDICTGIHSHHQKHQEENSMKDFTNTRKLMGRILFNVISH